jgi:hypothetical protein
LSRPAAADSGPPRVSAWRVDWPECCAGGSEGRSTRPKTGQNLRTLGVVGFCPGSRRPASVRHGWVHDGPGEAVLDIGLGPFRSPGRPSRDGAAGSEQGGGTGPTPQPGRSPAHRPLPPPAGVSSETSEPRGLGGTAAARTIATIPARIASGNEGQAVTTAARSGGIRTEPRSISTAGPVAVSVAVRGRIEAGPVGSWRERFRLDGRRAWLKSLPGEELGGN